MASDFRALSCLTVSAAASTASATALCGALENRDPAAPINAISHVFWGERAARADGPSLEYTAVGAAVNTAAMASWAVFHHLAYGRSRRQPSLAGSVARGAATAAIAYAVDYHVVPKRLTPGFEYRLSGKAMFGIYAALGFSLAVGEVLGGRRRQ